MSLFNPKTNAERGFHLMLSVGLLVAELYYIMNTFDIIPDGGIIGFLDDAIVAVVIGTLAFRLWASTKKRGAASMSAIDRYFQKNSIITIFTSANFWMTLILLGGAIWYFTWTYDFIPDTIGGIGYLDDAVAMIGTITLLIKFYDRPRGKK